MSTVHVARERLEGEATGWEGVGLIPGAGTAGRVAICVLISPEYWGMIGKRGVTRETHDSVRGEWSINEQDYRHRNDGNRQLLFV